MVKKERDVRRSIRNVDRSFSYPKKKGEIGNERKRQETDCRCAGNGRGSELYRLSASCTGRDRGRKHCAADRENEPSETSVAGVEMNGGTTYYDSLNEAV